MKPLSLLAWIALAVAMGAAMTKASGDVAVGIALGAAIATALTISGRRGEGCCGLSRGRQE